MKFWYKLGAKPRGRWNRALEFGGQFTLDERELNFNLSIRVEASLGHYDVPTQGGHRWDTTTVSSAPILDREGRWSQRVIYFLPADAEGAIAFALAVRDALLNRIAEARAIEPEPEIAEEFDSEAPALPANAPVRRIRMVS